MSYFLKMLFTLCFVTKYQFVDWRISKVNESIRTYDDRSGWISDNTINIPITLALATHPTHFFLLSSIRSASNEAISVLGRNERSEWEARYKDLAAEQDRNQISSCGNIGRSAFWPYYLQHVSKHEVRKLLLSCSINLSSSLTISCLVLTYKDISLPLSSYLV